MLFPHLSLRNNDLFVAVQNWMWTGILFRKYTNIRLLDYLTLLDLYQFEPEFKDVLFWVLSGYRSYDSVDDFSQWYVVDFFSKTDSLDREMVRMGQQLNQNILCRHCDDLKSQKMSF